MSWTRGEPLTLAHRERLLDAGVLPEVLAGLELREVVGPLPEWWHGQGNALYLRDGMTVPSKLIETMTLYPFADALLVIATGMEHVVSLLVGGNRALVFVGPDSFLAAGEIYCGADSAVVLNSGVIGTARPVLDARNGGSILAEPDQLWAANVYLATDDMHRFEDAATGERLNPYGARIRLCRHVWLGRDAIVTGDVEIGEGSVVGMRGLVRNQKVPPQVAVAGTPARIIREGVTWSADDVP